MRQEKKVHRLIGLMSGTSLDGLDICLCKFWQSNQQWKYEIVAAETLIYSREWQSRLASSAELTAEELTRIDREYGSWLGEQSSRFLKDRGENAELIVSHGHTVFHQAEKGYSLQIGHGAYIAANSGIEVVSDLRSLDLAYGGQGAPLVPLAEHYLLPEYDAFLNLGGIANLSVHSKKDKKVIGYDVCPANQVLNWLSLKYFDQSFDDEGKIARSGKLDKSLLGALNQLDFYSESGPRSLGREFVEENILPILEKAQSSSADQLRTFNQHIVDQIIRSLNKLSKESEILLSGGGANNQFMMELFRQKGLKIKIADKELLEYKEALCFAFLGLLRIKGIPNVFSSVTAASKNSSGGAHFLS